MAVPRVASQPRLGSRTGLPGASAKGPGSGGMGERTVSLPSLFPNAAPGRGGYPPLDVQLKRTPSQVLLERKEFGAFQNKDHRPQITKFHDLAQYSNHPVSIVPVDQPLFSVIPPVVAFADFEGLQTYEAVVTLRNQDNVARRIKVTPPDSPFFELVRKTVRGGSGDKVAPGMETSYVVRFKPDARIDYSYDLVVITERERFSVPIRCSGGSALLDFPDYLDFGEDCVVGHKSERTVLVRNIGDRSTKFIMKTSPPFSVVAPDGYLAEGTTCQVSVCFTPERAEHYECELHLKYGELEAVATLMGGAQNAEVSLSHSMLTVDDTYVGLETQGVVTIRNDSDVPVDFTWRLFPSVHEEALHRGALHTHLKQEEGDEMLYMQQAHLSDDSSDDSGSDNERLRARKENKLMSRMNCKYGNISKAIQEDPMLFRDAIFAIEPLAARVWPQSQLQCTCSFAPKDALVYSCTAYLCAVGQEERAPLLLKGLGIGPKATFSYDELDVGNVFVESVHRYEVQLLNQGDIEVDFRLTPRDTKFGSKFKFEPCQGTIAVGGQCEIVVDFRPSELGDFHEIFEWSLKGSATAVTLAFRGNSVQPTFEFDAEKITFGNVSFGFLNSRMLTLTNTSEVPCIYTLRIPGDEAPPKNEFDVIPAKGTLLPSCSQRVQVDFVSSQEKRYELRLAVDLEGVGQELLSIPIYAQSSVPQVSFEPHGCLEYGDVFIRYPFHQSLYLHNTSPLPAKFEVLPQEDKSRAEFEPDQWTGSVPPCASHVITVTLTAHMPGQLRIPMYVKIHGRAVPFPLVLVANSVGPRVDVDPVALDWGNVKCLEPVTRHVKLTNNSCIDASVRAFMNERKSLWSVHPKVIHLSPQETLQLAVTLQIDETCTVNDTLNLTVIEGNDMTVAVRGRGTDTPVKCDQDIEFIDFGTLFTTHNEPRDIVLKNYGQQARRINWQRDKEKEKKKDKRAEEQNPKKKGKEDDKVQVPIFRVEPEFVIMEPKSAYRFTVMAMSPHPGTVEESLVCMETPDKGGGVGKPIFKPKLKACFVAPALRLSSPELTQQGELEFEFLWEKNKPIEPLRKPLSLTNTGPLEIRFKVELQHPFSVDVEEGVIPSGETTEIMVEFDPGYKSDRVCSVAKQKLVITYDDHPAVNTVPLIGKVVWPNLEIETTKLDFGVVLNETTRKQEIMMKNKTALTVAYRWCFQLADETNPRTPAPLPSPMETRSTNFGGRSGMGTSFGAEPRSTAGGTFSHLEDVGSPGATGSVFGAVGPGSVASELGVASDQVDIAQIFDVLPIFGKLEPGETQTVAFTYYGMKDRAFKAQAICIVDGGPEYELQVKGAAAPCRYNIDRTELDFGDIPFTEVREQDMYLTNPGKVQAPFNFNLTGISRQVLIDFSPSTGVLKPEERLKVNVKFRAGMPDKVNETVLVEVAHFAPTKLSVRGNGTFPGIVLDLPRQDEMLHRQRLAAAARRIETARAITDASPEATAEPLDMPGTRKASARRETGAASVASPCDSSSAADEADETLPAISRQFTLPNPEPELDLELEVDRYNLCEVLLRNTVKAPATNTAASGLGRSTTSMLGRTAGSASPVRNKKKTESLDVTAAYYVCDFGHIALGQSCKKQIEMHNCCSEPVVVTVDKKLLKEYGFMVEPEHVKPVMPGKSTVLNVTATRPKEEDEGTVELEWSIPVKGGPFYKIQLIADFVLPDLVLSSEFIDFGRVVVGQKKRVVLEFRNEKDVAVDWQYSEQRDRYGNKLGPNDVVFDLYPASGVLMPGERKHLVASFSPRAAQQCNGVLQLRLRDNQKKKVINVVGRGDTLRVDVRPDLNYALGPVMPQTDGCSTEFTLYNPTDYAIEVFSVDFDKRYVEEELMLAEFDGYSGDLAEVPVRYAGDGTWNAVKNRVMEMRTERMALEAPPAGEGEDGAEPPEQPPAPEVPDVGECPEEEADDESFYPWRVPNADRVNALLAGPPKTGISTLARLLARGDRRHVLQLDEAVEWALGWPRYLHSDRGAKRIGERIREGEAPTVSEVAHLLRRRAELPDCNAGVIVDGLHSQYLAPPQVTSAVLEAFRAERVVLLSISLPATEATEEAAAAESSSASADGAAADAEEAPKPPSAAGKALGDYYKALQPALETFSEELEALVAEKAAAHTAAQEAAEAAAAKVEAAIEAAKEAASPEAGEDGSGSNAVEPEVPDEATVEAKKEAERAAREVRTAAEALAEATADLERCKAAMGWEPPPVEPDPDAAAEPVDPKAKAKADPKAKAKAKAAPAPEEEAPVADPAVEQVVGVYSEQRIETEMVVQQFNATAQADEEERQRDIERRKRARRAALAEAKKAQNPRGSSKGRGKGEPAPEDLTAADFIPNMENWVQPASAFSAPLDGPPFGALEEWAREVLPLPKFPAEEPLPKPTVMQMITPPAPREPRAPVANFSILTPVPIPPAAAVSRTPSKEAPKEPPADGEEPAEEEPQPTETLVSDKTRWIIEPLSEQRLYVHFSSEEVATHSAALRFELVGDATCTPTIISCSGVAALPGITSDPRIVFPRRKKKRPQDGYAVKSWVTSLGIYDFGPLLAGRDAEARKPPPPVEVGEGSASGDQAQDADQTQPLEVPDSPENARKETAVSAVIMRYAESIRITNDSLFPANVSLGLASQGGDFAPAPAEGEAAPPPAEGAPSPFIVEPETLQLEVGEQADVKVWCFPPDKGVFEDRLVARIEHNPEPVGFNLCALGEVPWASLDMEEVNFGRLMMNIRADDQRVRIRNTTALPVKWQLLCNHVQVTDDEPRGSKTEPGDPDAPPQVPDEFMVEPMDGTLAAGEERDVRIGFRATRPATFNFGLQLNVRDDQGFRNWQEAAKVGVHAETFAVEAVVEPNPHETPLDFGTVLVNTSQTKTFDIVNCGRFTIRYELAVRRALRDFLTIDTPRDEIPKGERRTITVTCTPKGVVEVPSDRDGIMLQVFDTLSGETVDTRIPPLRVGLTAVYNSFQVTPPRGLNFGPVEKGEKQTRTFTVRNVGIFSFDWALFNYAEPPKFNEDNRPSEVPSSVSVGPFTVNKASGKLEPDEEAQVEVTFVADGDQDYDSKIGIWVDGVHGDGHFVPPADSAMMAQTAGGFGVSAFPGTSAYLLTGQSCVPGINTSDLQTMFEEQFVARTLEDAISIAGRPDVRVFCEADRIFHFGPVLAHGGGRNVEHSSGVTEFVRLTNPKAIPCEVHLEVKPRGDAGAKGGKGGSDELAFEVMQSKVVIQPHDSQQVQVKFLPKQLGTYSGMLEATVPAGSDPQTNFFACELRGDGAVPSVSVHGPQLFTDKGGELHLGKLALGRSHEVRMALRNDGLLPATVRVEIRTPSVHFTLACPPSVTLSRNEQRTFQVRFHPRSAGPATADMCIRTLGNEAFEDVGIQLMGEGYSDDVAWDLTEVKRPGGAAGARADEEPSQEAAPPSPDDLQLGEVAVGGNVSMSFQLTNSTPEKLRFEFPAAMPAPFGEQLAVSPSKGFVEPNSRQPMMLSFRPTAPLEASKVPVACKVAQVRFEGEPGEDGEQPYTELDGTARELPLHVSATADTGLIECDVTEIAFSPTVMFYSKVYRFKVRNPSKISAPFEWRVQGKAAAAFTVTPLSGSVPAGGEREIEVRFAPVEVEDFGCTLLCMAPGVEAPLLKLLLGGTALRPWCHIELTESDYRTRRQAEAPLDPKYHVVEIVSLGTHVKNTKRFYVYNPTADAIDFIWMAEAGAGANKEEAADEDTFRCLTKKGRILPGKKYEMVFEFVPQSIETRESFWTFLLVGPKVTEHFLVAGTVEEPRIGMDTPAINFGERLLESSASETVKLVNKEHLPFSFSFDQTSFHQDGQPQVLSISPMKGVLSPDGELDVEVTFKPMMERSFNFNVVCNIKRKKEPVVLNIKGIGYKIHASLALDEPTGRRIIYPGTVEPLEFGLLQVHEKRTVTLNLANSGKKNFNFQVKWQQSSHTKPRAVHFEKAPYLAISQATGDVKASEEHPVELTYAPKDVHNLAGSILQVIVPAGPKEEVFQLALAGGAKRSRLDFNFLSHDFGPCFIAKGGATMAGEPFAVSEDQGYARVDLIATNRDDSDCLISTTFQREPWLDVQLNAAMIEAGGSLRIPIIFSPREVSEYMQRVEFLVNDYTRMFVDIRGRGCPLKLELAQIEMQHVNFGVVTGGETLTKMVRVVNRSPRPVTFELTGEGDELIKRSIGVSPAHPTTLRPRDSLDVELIFSPTTRVAPFKLPVLAKCDGGVEVKLLTVEGTCHATEMRLSEHSVFFGEVVVGSQATSIVKLCNFGDLGAKFKFEMPSRYAKLFSVTPSEGFVRPQEEIPLTIAFHPTRDRVMEIKKSDRSKRKLPSADATARISVKDIRCILDGHAPLMLEATGCCMERKGETKTLEFTTEVRKEAKNTIEVTNTQDVDWRVHPQVTNVEPAGTNFFTCPREVIIPAKKSATVEVTYFPLMMTGGDGEAGVTSPSGKARAQKHLGSVFIGTPDGNAIHYTLEGSALPPKVDKRIQERVPCKKRHMQRVPVQNWLHERQRFDVKVELSDPAPEGVSVQGVGTLDLPAGLTRDYRFSVYAYHEGSALVKVSLTSQETGEFIVVEVELDFYTAESLATINLEAACRQQARHKIAVANPLNRPAKFTGSSSHPYICFSHDLEVPAKSERTIDLLFRPVEEGEGEAEAVLKSDELGTYPYTVSWRATPAGVEKALVLKAPLGGSTVDFFKFKHLAQQAVDYKAKIEMSHQSSSQDFILEDTEVKAPACEAKGEGSAKEMQLRVRFQPSALGECRGTLIVKGAGGGEYKAMLTGYAQPPQPQGPFDIGNGKATTVEFRNPFDKATEFTFQIDHPCFTVPMRSQMIDPQKTVQINVSFKSDKVQCGRLIISCKQVSTPWVFYLKGQM